MTDTLDLGGGVTAHTGVLNPELVPTTTIHPHPQNPRRGDTGVIGKSVDAHGLYAPIRVQRSTGYIVAGNHTYKALVERGAEQVPVIFLDLTDSQALEVMADDNHSADFGTYDDSMLLAILTRDDVDPVTYSGDDELLAILTRRVDAEGVFVVGAENMVDEFRAISGQDQTEYNNGYHAKVSVYFRDGAAVEEFRKRLGLDEKVGAVLHYPLGWKP